MVPVAVSTLSATEPVNDDVAAATELAVPDPPVVGEAVAANVTEPSATAAYAFWLYSASPAPAFLTQNAPPSNTVAPRPAGIVMPASAR